MNNKRVSIIIPVYNESNGIKSLVDSLIEVKEKCEVIFVDGGSTDNTVAIIEEKFLVLSSAKKGRAWQMNYGALNANGSILFFLHGDSTLPTNFLDEIETVISKGYKVGCFKLKFESKSILMSICGFMSNLRVRTRNIAFGDQGIFVLKDYFQKINMYPELNIMEDYQFSINVKKAGEKFGVTRRSIITSERRFIKYGRLKTMIKMQRFQYMYRKGIEINEY